MFSPFPVSTENSSNNNTHEIIILILKDRADSSGNEGGTAGNTDPELGGTNSDGQQQQQQLQQQQLNAQNTSPPKDLPISSGDKRKTIFRTSSNTPSSSAKKKQSLSFTSEPPKLISTLESCLSPTNVEPRKSLLEQLSRTFATIDETVLPEVVAITGPPEPSGNSFIHRITSLLTSTVRPNIILFQAQNTAEIKAILQSIMNKIQK